MLNWFKNLGTQGKLLFLFSLTILLGTVSIAWFILNTVHLNREIENTWQRASELTNVEDLQVFLLQQQLAIEGYRLSGDDYYIVQYEEAEGLAQELLRRSVIDANSAEEQDALAQLGDEIRTYNDAFAGLTALHQQGDTEAAMRLAAEIDLLQEERIQRIHDQIERFVYKGSLSVLDEAEETDIETKQTIVVGAAVLVIFSLLAITASIVTNQVSEPILHLINAVVAFENDAFEPQLLEGYVQRRDEMGKLARAFSNMTHSIQQSARYKDQLLAASERFVPNAYLDFLEKETIVEINLGDHVSAEMAVMFSDIRSFTTISEAMTPQENFDFVNAYLRRVSPVIQANNGFIVKYLGDGMMAVFPFNAEDAVQAGIDKVRVVNAYNAERADFGRRPINVGVGIHTGHMMVGMVGESARIQGDAFSDNVNLTSRIEGLTKHFGTSLIISSETIARLENPGKFAIRNLGRAQVKGREQPIGLHEVFDGDPEPVRQAKLKSQDDFERALKLYVVGQFSEAAELFTRICRLNPEDNPAEYYRQRAAYNASHGTPELWNGVEIMTSK